MNAENMDTQAKEIEELHNTIRQLRERIAYYEQLVRSLIRRRGNEQDTSSRPSH